MQSVDTARRAFLRGRPARPDPVRPPWAAPRHFTDLCTRCGACAGACAEGTIVHGDGGYPEVDFSLGACTFCGACADACPEPAFLRPADPWRLTLRIAAGCMAESVVCRSCADACPERALRFPRVVGGARPEIDASACTGCGACVAPCPVAAISLTPVNAASNGIGNAGGRA